MKVRIRTAEPRDAEALTELADAVSSEPEGWLISTNGEWRSPADERRYLKALKRYPHAAVLVAETDEGRVVGRLSLSRDTHPASGHVADLGLMVAKDVRGRGIGTALLHAAVAWARGNEVRKLELHVFPWNAGAIAMYEKFGFEREGFRKGHYNRAGEDVDAILMALRV
jgi:RimJ/RimL family protein N-acetyltransferase